MGQKVPVLISSVNAISCHNLNTQFRRGGLVWTTSTTLMVCLASWFISADYMELCIMPICVWVNPF